MFFLGFPKILAFSGDFLFLALLRYLLGIIFIFSRLLKQIQDNIWRSKRKPKGGPQVNGSIFSFANRFFGYPFLTHSHLFGEFRNLTS